MSNDVASLAASRAFFDLLVLLFGETGAWIALGAIVVSILGVWLYSQYVPNRPSTGSQFPPGCCTECGYDLTGNESGRCPECGKRIRPPWMFR